MRRLLSPANLSGRIVLATLGVTAVTLVLLSVGILVVGASTFADLMVNQGSSARSAHEMFDHSIAIVFVVAALAGSVVAVGLGLFLARRISRPIEQAGDAARRLATGDYGARLDRRGPAELTTLADSFNQMAEALQQQEAMRADLIANFAHELRTPLTNLRGYLEGMRDGVIAPEPEIFGSLRDEVERLDRLSRSLDTLADTGGPGQPLATVDLDLVAAVRAAAELAHPALERGRIGVRLALPERLPARAVPDHVAQVLANLLQNAARYTPAGGTVSITATAEPGTALVTVTNTGTEIPAADLPHVFERFYRVDRSRARASGGAGIGLAIVRQLVEQAGGRVGVESSAGSTRFWFRLPG